MSSPHGLLLALLPSGGRRGQGQSGRMGFGAGEGELVAAPSSLLRAPVPVAANSWAWVREALPLLPAPLGCALLAAQGGLPLLGTLSPACISQGWAVMWTTLWPHPEATLAGSGPPPSPATSVRHRDVLWGRYVCLFICTSVCIFVSVYLFVFMYVYLYVCLFIHVSSDMCRCVRLYCVRWWFHLYTYLCLFVCVYMRWSICTCLFV